MKTIKNLGLVVCLWLMMLPAQSAMVSTPELLEQPDRAELVNLLQREDVQHQLIEMGVDPVASLRRVDQMTNQEVASLHGQIADLPVGASLDKTNMVLLIIILVLLLV